MDLHPPVMVPIPECAGPRGHDLLGGDQASETRSRRRRQMRHRMLLISFVAAGLAFAQPEAGELNRGIVKITAHKPDGTAETGAGLIVAVDGDTAIVVTAHHVIAEAKAIEVVLFAKQYAEFPAKPFRRFHEDLDLGLLTVALPHDVAAHLEQPFPVADSGDLREGDKLIIVGHPRNLEWQSSMNVNTVSGLSEGEDSRRFRFTKTALAQGNSGGGVFKDDGSLLGLATKLSPEYAVAVKVDALLFVLRQEWGIATWWRTDDARAALGRELAGHAVATRNEVAKKAANEDELNWLDLLENPDRRVLLERSALLALESLKRSRTAEGERALRDALAWLPWPALTLDHYAYWAVFTPDGKHIVSAASTEARVWETATRREILRIDLSKGGSVSAITLSHDGRLLASFGEKSVIVWRILTGDAAATLPQPSHDSSSYTAVDSHAAHVATLPQPSHNDRGLAVFSPDDKLLATATRWDDHAVRLWAIPSGRPVAELVHAGRVRLAAFSPDGNHVVTTSGADGTEEQETAWVWSVASGRQTKRLDHRERVCAIAFSPDGKYLVTTDRSLLRTWNASTFAHISDVQVQGGIYDLLFSPDSRHLLVGSWYNEGVALLEAGTWRALSKIGEGALTAGVFAPGRTYVALTHRAIGKDKSSRVWDADTGREIARLALEWWREVSAFSPDGQYALTPDGGFGPVKLWPLTLRDPIATACARLTRNLTPDEWHRYLGREPYRRTCANLP
ncbi:MAG: trypsin-like peptidase domain-containing protein [Candidatus Solibacter sp.]|nr:trypsin-like peptidase domain-containing protein [Candidatus Solibacter sp.]